MSEDIARAIRQRNMHSALRLMFEGNLPAPRLGFCRESELWDYKKDCPRPGKNVEAENSWASIASDVLAFHNQNGGLIFFGIDDSFSFTGATYPLDSKMFNDKIRRYLPDNIFVEYSREAIQVDQRYLGVALVPPRGPLPARFRTNAPLINGKSLFEKGGTALREGDSTRILSCNQADAWIRTLQIPTVGNELAVDEPHYRILAPEYSEFISRQSLGEAVERSLLDQRVSTTSLIGLGGIGKTALATWATLRAYESKRFDFIVSMTAKDRELTSTGILGLQANLTSFERLLDEILDVLQFHDLKPLDISGKAAEVEVLLQSGRGLLYVDNLETVDDVRIIDFLDNLPLGTHALVTSRRTRVRVSTRPIEVPPMSDDEVEKFVLSLVKEMSFKHLSGMKPAEASRVGASWNKIPLAIKWSLARSTSVIEAIAKAEAAVAAGRHGEELLEFSFRRVFEGLTQIERQVLQVLSILQRPIPLEAVVAGTAKGNLEVIDSLDELTSDALVVREFDPDRNDYCYTVLPITRAFVQHDMSRDMTNTRRITKQLTSWFEAFDVKSSDERLIVRELRQGSSTDEGSLLDLASIAERDGKYDTAEKLLRQAMNRTPKSWRAAKAMGEFLRHRRHDYTNAIQMYSMAAVNAPSRGADRALIYREYGILLRESGEPDAANKAADALRVAVTETPSDLVAVGALAQVLDRKGSSREIITLLESYESRDSERFHRIADPILLRAYERTNEMLKAALLRQRMNPEP